MSIVELATEQPQKPAPRLTLARREALWGYLFISPWIFGFLVPDPGPGHRDVHLHVPEPAPEPAAAGSVRRPRQLRRTAQRPARVGCALRHAPLRRDRAARRTHPSLRPRAPAEQQARARVAVHPDALLHAVHHPVRRRSLRLGQHAQRRAGMAERALGLGRHPGPGLAERPDMDLSRPRRHRPLGHRQRDDHQHRRPSERPDGALRRRARGRGGLLGQPAQRDHPADVAGPLLQPHPRTGRRPPVLPRPARAQQRHRPTRRGRRTSSTSTSTTRSSASGTCRTARPWHGRCSW